MNLDEYQQAIYDEFDYPNKGNNLSYPILELISAVGAISKLQVKSLKGSSSELDEKGFERHLLAIAKLLFIICEELGIKFEKLIR